MHCSKARLFLASPALLLTNRDYDRFFLHTKQANSMKSLSCSPCPSLASTTEQSGGLRTEEHA